MVMELCGSGGVLRRGDPDTGRPAYPVGDHGVNQQPHDWTWQKTGIHWYCSHCAIAMEWLPAKRNGRLLRPLDHVMDPNVPCTWYVYKDEDQNRAYHYPRTRFADPPRRAGSWRGLAGGVSGRKLNLCLYRENSITPAPIFTGITVVEFAIFGGHRHQ